MAVALAEKAFPEAIGARVNLASGGLPGEFILFGEDASRILLSCDPNSLERIQQIAAQSQISADVIGETIPDRLEISLDGLSVVSAAVSPLNQMLRVCLRGEPADRSERW